MRCPGPRKAWTRSPRHSGGQQGPAQVLSKAQRKPRDSLEGRRALPRLWQNMEKDQGNSGEKQGSSQQSPAQDLGHSGGKQGPARALQSPLKAPGNTGGQQGFLSTLEKGFAGVRVFVGLCTCSTTQSSTSPTPSPSPEPRSKMETHHLGPPTQKRPGPKAVSGPHLPVRGRCFHWGSNEKLKMGSEQSTDVIREQGTE